MAEAADNNIYTVTATAAADTQNSVSDVGRSVRVATPIDETRTGRRAGAFFTIVLRAVRLPISVAQQPYPHHHSTRAKPLFVVAVKMLKLQSIAIAYKSRVHRHRHTHRHTDTPTHRHSEIAKTLHKIIYPHSI